MNPHSTDSFYKKPNERWLLEAINEILREGFVSASEEDVAKKALQLAEKITGSKFGFIGEVSPSGKFDTIAMSDPGMDDCKIEESQKIKLINNMEIRGLWGKVIKDGKSLIVNDPSSHPDSVGTPQGHTPITSFLGVPFRYEDKTVGMIALANKEGGYVEEDETNIEKLFWAFAETIRRKKIERTYRESEEKWRSLTENTPDYIMLLDQEGNVLFTNKKAFGLRRDDMVGKTIFDFVPKKYAEDAKDCLRNVLGSGETRFFKTTYEDAQGRKYYLDVRVGPVFRRNRVEGFVTCFTDITRKVEAEEALYQSEAAKESILKAAPIGIGVIKNRIFRMVNEGFCLMMGYSQEELINKSTRTVYPDDEEYAKVGKLLYDQIRKEGRGMMETTLKTKDGRLIKTLLNSSPINTNSLGDGVAFSCLDITESKRLEDILEKSEERYRKYFDESMDIFFTIDSNLRFLTASKSAEKVLGYRPEEIIGKAPFDFDLIAPESMEQIKKNIDSVLSGKNVLDYEYVLKAKNGDKKIIVISASPLIRDGKTIGISGIARDITEKKRLEKIQEGLLHADRLMLIGQLAAGIAHEINNPAAFVVANMSALSKNMGELKTVCLMLQTAIACEDAEKCRNSIEDVYEKTRPFDIFENSLDMLKESLEGMDRIKSIVRNLRVFSRSEKENYEKVNINEIVDIAANMTFNEIRHKSRLEKDYSLMPEIVCDKGKIAQVIVNMILNAVQAISGPPNENKIKISTGIVEDRVVISISDTGCGIQESLKSRIFEPFFTTKSKDVGTGLGLSLCVDIVHKHGGTIDVESELGKGSRFSINLPIRSVYEPKILRDEYETQGQTMKYRGRVLIVDDEELLLKAYKRYLEPQHDVCTALGGDQAIKILEDDRNFDIILCDIVMPGMSGMEFYNYLKDRIPALTERVVFCSGSGMGSHAKKYGLDLSNTFLEKPIDMEVLKNTIDRMLAKGRV